MESVRGSLTTTIAKMSKLSEDPVYPPVPPADDVAQPMAGELVHLWLVQMPSASGSVDEIQLPSWLTDGIDAGISRWVNENETWDKEIAKRHTKGGDLVPKRQAAYDAWREHPERRCS